MVTLKAVPSLAVVLILCLGSLLSFPSALEAGIISAHLSTAALLQESLGAFTLQKLISGILGVLIPAIFTVQTFKWLQGKLSLRYYKSEDLEATVGSLEFAGNVDLSVSKISHGDKEYSRVRILKYQVLNQDRRTPEEKTHFFFVDSKTAFLDPSSVVSVHCSPPPDSNDLIDWERMDKENHGPGVVMTSDILGGAQMQFTLILDLDSDPGLASKDIVMRKRSRSGEGLDAIDPSKRTVSFTMSRFILWIVGSAFVWGGGWLLLNISLGNISTGARILDALLKTVGFSGFLDG